MINFAVGKRYIIRVNNYDDFEVEILQLHLSKNTADIKCYFPSAGSSCILHNQSLENLAESIERYAV